MAARDGQDGHIVSMAMAEAEAGQAPAPDLRLTRLTANDLPHVWEQVRPLLERACEYSAGEFTPESVVDAMGARDGTAWLHMLAIVRDARAVTSIMLVMVNNYPAGRKLDCVLVSGERVEEWMPFEPQMDAWARELGCVAVRIPRARKGWLRVLSHWARKSGDVCVMERDL